MRPQAAIAVAVLLIALCVAALTESWVAWAVTLASAAWLAWVAADAVVQHVTTRPFDLDGTQTKEP